MSETGDPIAINKLVLQNICKTTTMAEIQKPIPFRFRLFRLPIVGDWLYHWHDQQELKKLNQEYSPLIQAAKQTKNEEALKLEENLYHKSRLIEDAAAGRNSEKLLAKARRWGVVPPIKSEKSNDWYRSNITGDLILVPETGQRLRREITEQVRGAIDEARKNTTLVIAVLGFLLSCGLLVINVFTLRSNRHAVEVTEKNAKNQLDAMQRQLELQQRPWIKITEIKAWGKGPVIPAFHFRKFSNAAAAPIGADLYFMLGMKNVGHSVAEVALRSELYVPPWEKFGQTLPEEKKKFCSAPHSEEWYPSVMLFPDEPPYQWGQEAMHFVEASSGTRVNGQQQIVAAAVIVCVDYRIRTAQKTYQTSAVYDILPQGGGKLRLFQLDARVPADQLRLERNPLYDDAY
jgi:hypothetical protein